MHKKIKKKKKDMVLHHLYFIELDKKWQKIKGIKYAIKPTNFIRYIPFSVIILKIATILHHFW